jgi:hypothetical protein
MTMYEMTYDPDRALLNVVKRGFWSIATFRDFVGDFLTLDRDIKRREPRYRIFADCRDYSVQSAEISEAYTELFDDLSVYHQGRFAIVVNSVLARMQAKRAMPHTIVEVFTDDDEAMRWLFEEGATAR